MDVPGKDQCVLVGVSWVLGLGKYKLCKVVTLAPRFILVNNLARRLCFREHGGEPPGNSNLEPEAQTSLLFMRPRDEKCSPSRILVSTPNGAPYMQYSRTRVRLTGSVRSAPVLIQEVGTTHVRVYPPGDSSSPDLVKVVTAVEGATVFVYFTQEIGPWPFRIENDSDFQFWLTQSVSTTCVASISIVTPLRN